MLVVAHTGISPVKTEQQIRDFLAKPQIITNFEWDITDGANVVLWSNSIATMLFANVVWTRKIEGYNLLRGTAVIRVQINAQPFQQGRLLLHFIPLADQLPADMIATKNYDLTCKTQQPHVELDARDTACELRIPYVTPIYWYDAEEDKYDWGNAYLSVLSPLEVGSGGPTTVDCTVWLHFEDFELAAPTFPQMSSGHKLVTKSARAHKVAPVDREADVMANGGTVSNALASVGAAATVLQDVPIISALAGPVAWASNIGANLASIFGFSKPDLEGGIQSIRNDPLAYAINSAGTVPSTNLGLNPTNKIQITDSFAGTDIDEMSLNYLKQIPAFVHTHTWTNTDASGTQIANMLMTPDSLVTSYVIPKGTANYTVRTMPPFVYLANYFQLYRGSIKLIMKFIKTDFHSGRLVVAYNPTGSGTTTNNTNSQYAHRDIIDIREASEYCFTIPYMKAKSWLEHDEILGTVSIHVLNELRAPETCSSSIKILMYFCAGSDFEYAIPIKPHYIPIVPQMNTNAAVTGVNKPIGTSSIDDTSIDHSTLCIGEKVSSLKELALRSTQIYTGATDLYATGFTLYPFALDIARPTTNSTTPTYLGFMDVLNDFAAGFALWRGSMNVQVTNTAVNDASWMVGLYPTAGGSAFVDTLAGSKPKNSTFAGDGRNIPWFVPNNGYNMVNVKVPYYNQTRSTVVKFSTGVLGTDYDRPKTRLLFQNSGSGPSVETAIVRRSVADDYQLGYFTGFPPLMVSAS